MKNEGLRIQFVVCEHAQITDLVDYFKLKIGLVKSKSMTTTWLSCIILRSFDGLAHAHIIRITVE